MTLLLLTTLVFVVVTYLSRLVLRMSCGQRAVVDNRLRRHAGSYARPSYTSDEGEALTESIRHVPVRSAAQAVRSPVAKLLAASVQRRRQEAFRRQIVDALTLISTSMKAGYSFIQAMDMVAREVPAPLGEEFGMAVHEMSLGATVDESLEEMVRRVGLEDLGLVVTAVLVQRQVGGNLTEVLDTIAHTIRERQRIQGEIKTLTAQGRISGIIIGLLPVGLTMFISLLNPTYMSTLFQSSLGLFLLFLGCCGEITGVLLIRRIIRIEV